MTLGQRISHHRKQLGISQEMLGERLGVSRQAVSKWETDAAMPDMENLLALAREFGVSVAELTETPETQTSQAERSKRISVHPTAFLWIFAVVFVILFNFGADFLSDHFRSLHEQEITSPAPSPEMPTTDVEESVPSPAPETDFALLWYGTDGDEEFLELGVQEDFFPFGTTLELTAPAVILDTDFHLATLHETVCGAINLDYLHMEEDLEYDPDSPTRESILRLSTIAPSVRTPRGVHVGSTKAQVTEAYGDKLVYCLKEPDSYTLVQHDYYYIYQPDYAFSKYLAIYMRDGLVAGLLMEDLIDVGNDFFDPDHVNIFPVVNGEPDFSLREEPEQEILSDARKVYIAWNQLVTNNNLSAEEQYTYRREIFSLLPTMDWREFGQMGAAAHEEDTIFALMSWIANQDSYASSEILWLQMGCTAAGIDGAYADMYAHMLARALFHDPTLFAKALASEYPAEAKTLVLHLTAYDAEWYPAELATATQILEAHLASYSPSETEAGWIDLLLLYLSTPIDDRPNLPNSPENLQ